MAKLDFAPIETHYQGYRFRSRLEARWAVFLDAANIQWEYEVQGYTLNGVNYLPDFWLPANNAFLEIKPSVGPDFYKQRNKQCANLQPTLSALANATGADVFLIMGSPSPDVYDQNINDV